MTGPGDAVKETPTEVNSHVVQMAHRMSTFCWTNLFGSSVDGQNTRLTGLRTRDLHSQVTNMGLTNASLTCECATHRKCETLLQMRDSLTYECSTPMNVGLT